MEKIATELKELLSTHIRGISDVTVEQGIICVYVRSLRAAKSVIHDLCLSRGFSSVKGNTAGKGFVIHAIPA
jgi:hypothetical protein